MNAADRCCIHAMYDNISCCIKSMLYNNYVIALLCSIQIKIMFASLVDYALGPTL